MNRHLTSEEISAWEIGEPSAESLTHLGECATCRNEADVLQEAFGQFRDSGERWSEHWYTAPRTRRADSPWSWRSLAAVGGLISAAMTVLLMAHRPTPTPRADDRPFLAIPYVAPLAPYERTTVVRLDVAMTALQAAGFEVHAPELGGAMTVDVLLGQDGRAHAIRPIAKGGQE